MSFYDLLICFFWFEHVPGKKNTENKWTIWNYLKKKSGKIECSGKTHFFQILAKKTRKKAKFSQNKKKWNFFYLSFLFLLFSAKISKKYGFWWKKNKIFQFFQKSGEPALARSKRTIPCKCQWISENNLNMFWKKNIWKKNECSGKTHFFPNCGWKSKKNWGK